MTTPAERLAAAIHMESAAIAPQTSPLIEAAKEVLEENERLQFCLNGRDEFIVDRGLWHEFVAGLGRTLHQQLTPKEG